MTQIDWSKAPEGAEIHLPDQAGTVECFVMFRNSEVYYAYPGMTQWVRWSAESKKTLLARFRYSSKAWTGEGLPPVGIDCQIDLGSHWAHATIIAHHDGGAVAAVHEDDLSYSYRNADADYFRPIRTPAQLAAEEREKAIEFMMQMTSSLGHSDVSKKILFKELYDKGLRFEVKP